MPFPDPTKELTRAAMLYPEVGDRYTEMFAFWLYVLKVTPNFVTTMEANGGARDGDTVLPRDGIVKTMTREEFIERLSYTGSVEGGFWVFLVDRRNDVEGWLDYHEGKVDVSG